MKTNTEQEIKQITSRKTDSTIYISQFNWAIMDAMRCNAMMMIFEFTFNLCNLMRTKTQRSVSLPLSIISEGKTLAMVNYKLLFTT